jgi:hypothetical protein
MGFGVLKHDNVLTLKHRKCQKVLLSQPRFLKYILIGLYFVRILKFGKTVEIIEIGSAIMETLWQ